MKCLLDTHAYLWQIDASPDLSPVARDVIDDDDNDVLLSIASLWEIAIKVSLGKLRPRYTMLELAIRIPATFSYESLPITPAHLDLVSRLPLHHRDSFDRLIVAQCIAEGLAIVSNDTILDRYGIERIW